MTLKSKWRVSRLINKKTQLFILFITLSLGILQAQNAHITLTLKSEPLTKALTEIEKVSKMPVNYKLSDLNIKKKISVDLKNSPIREALNRILDGTGLSYKIEDRRIFVFREVKQKMQKIEGLIRDNEGQPLIGVNVKLKGSNHGVVTDLDGKFQLNASLNSFLVISYIGYKTREVEIVKTNLEDIVLNEDSEVLDEVVVTALGIKRSEKALAYNVQKINADDLNSVKSANFMNSLVGKVAGVTIQNSATGMGGTTKVVMRGSKSLTKSNNALYVIDGIPMKNTSFSNSSGFLVGSLGGTESAADINPEDIESVSMLTGPSAAALYGYDGANGVVLITTKKGIEGKVKIAVSSSVMCSNVASLYETQNRYGNLSGDFESWGDKLGTPSLYNPKEFFKTGMDVINSLTLTTGTKTNQTYVSASTTNSNGILPNSKYNRYNFSVRNTSSFCKDKIELDLNANYIIQNNTNLIGQGQYFNPLQAVYLFPRGENFDAVRMYQRFDTSRSIYTQYWPYGDQGMAMQNPYWTMNKMEAKSSKKRYMLSAGLTYRVAKGVDLSGRIKVDNTYYVNTHKRNASTLTLLSGPNGYYSEMMREDANTYADLLLNIDKDFATDWNVNANIGTSFDDLQIRGLNAGLNLGNIPNLFTLQNVKEEYRVGAGHNKSRHQTQSVFANVELNYKKTYYLTLTGRNDWDSNLAYSDQLSFFYKSAGGSVIISELCKLPNWIRYAKLRGSYAEVATAFSQYLSNPYYEYDVNTKQFNTSAKLPAHHLKPEESKSWEIGCNLVLFDDFRFDATYYHSNTLNQSFYVALSPASGYTSALVQAGNVENKGLEMALSYGRDWGNFRWDTSLTYTMNRNKVLKLANGALNPETGEPITMDEMPVAHLGKPGRGAEVILRPGQSMGEIYVRHGLMQDGNNEIVVDGNGNLTVETYKEPKHIGSLLPKYNVGMSNSFSYKGLNLNIVLSARVGGLVTSVTQGILDYYGVSKASADARDAGGVIVNRFNAPVDAKKYYQTVGGGEGGVAQYYMYDATNIRLQEVNLSYTFPRKWFNNRFNLKAGIIARNLAMIYCKAPFDPELSAATSSTFYQGVDYFMQPSTRSIGFNFKLEF